MDWVKTTMAAAIALLICVSEDVEAYGSYIPIRPANRITPYHEPEPYTHPGVILLGGSRWEGHDNLSCLPHSLRVVTEVISDPEYDLWFPCQQAQAELEMDLKRVGIEVMAPVVPPEGFYRPFLHLLIFVTPCSEGNAVHISLRLFETDPTFKRGEPKTAEVWQVITWEKQAMFFSPTGSLVHDVRQQVATLSDEFTRRFVLEKRHREAAQKGKEPPGSRGCFTNFPRRDCGEDSCRMRR